jgi:hypothetical protein
MATTIKLKNGSGAPLAGDLVQGEPAFDLTNKRLYTEDSGGTVIEVGTNPSTLTVDTDTLAVDATNNRVGIGTTSPTSTASAGPTLEISGTAGGNLVLSDSNATSGQRAKYLLSQGGVLYVGHSADNGTSPVNDLVIDASGNVGIGTSSPSFALGTGLHIDSSGYTTLNLQKGGVGQGHCIDFTDASNAIQYRIGTNFASGGENLLFAYGSTPTVGMTLNSSGNVGIGTASPTFGSGSGLEVERSGSATVRVERTGATAASGEFFAGNGKVVIGSTSNTHLEFRTNSTENMRIDSSGNVGIGVTSMSSILHTDCGAPSSSDKTLALFQSQSSRQIGFVWDDSASTLGIANFGSQAMAFHVGGNSSEKMRIDTSGLVGIGTTSPSSYYADNLVVAAPDQGGITIAASATSDTNYLMFADGTSGNEAYRGYIGFNHATDALNILSHGFMRFYTGPSTQERMRIDSNGNLLVGTTSTTQDTSNFGTRIGGTAAPGYLASYRNVNGTGVAVLFGGNAGQVYVRGDGDLENTNNNYGAISDERLKSDIVDASSQIDDIMAVQVRSYTLNETGDTHIGVVAQELEASGMSGLVKTDDEGMKSVKYSILYMKAIKALQEAVTRIETLEAEVAAFKGE